MSSVLTVVTPIDFGRRPRNLLARAIALCEVVEPSIQLVFGHADRGTKYDKKFIRFLRENKKSNVDVVSVFGRGDVNHSKLRNVAAEAASSDVLLFVDVDIYFDSQLLASLAAQVRAGDGLAMAPCLYLSRKGTRRLFRCGRSQELIEDALAFSSDLALHWAIPSSIIAVSRRDFVNAGGFCEQYEGHGYEDFDFIIRVALMRGLIKGTQDLLVDRPCRAPLLSQGFRGSLGCLCLRNLVAGKIALHLYHEKDSSERYYLLRMRNATMFNRRLTAMLARVEATPVDEGVATLPPMLPIFYRECKAHNVDPWRYLALFDARPRHMLHRRAFYARLWGGMAKYVKNAFARGKVELAT